MGEENKTKQVRVKIVHKHETEEHWNVSNYIPEIGEVVFYDPDSLHNYTRQKNGDGVHVVKDLPFAVEGLNSDTTYNLSASKNMTNGNVTLDLAAGGSGSGTDSVVIRGAGAVEVTTDNDGIVTVYSSTAEAAGASLGLVKTGGDVTISEGIIAINDDSHNHTIDNIKGLQAALDDKAQAEHSHDYILISQKGNINGVAELDSEGKVPNAQLPSSVNNVVEGYYKSSDKLFYKEDYYTTPIVGEIEKIYVDILTNKIYRWGGDASKFVIVSETVEVGTNTGTALDGKIGNDHIMSLGNPHNVTKEQVGLSKVENERQYSQNNPPPYPVVSVAGKTGEVALNASDVGLGYVENKSSATIRSELTKDNITNALGYTPAENAGITDIEITGDGNAITTAEYNKTNKILTLTKGATYNNYTHPRHIEKDSGLYKITIDNQGHVSEAEAVEKADIVALGIPEKDTTYEVVSTGAAGLAPALPTSGATTKYLRGDGTWQIVSTGQTNQNAFSKIAVNGQASVEADQVTDTLNLVAGDNISITTDAQNDKITIGVINPSFDTVYANTIAPKDGDEIYLAGDLVFSCDDCGTQSTLLETHETALEAQKGVQNLDNSLAEVAKSGSYDDLTNKPSIPSINGLATEKYVDDKVAGIIDSSPETLNTLNELAQALGDDPNFAATVSENIGKKVDKTTTVNGQALSGNVTLDKDDIGLGNVPNVATNDQTPTFTEATSLANIASGEKVSTLFGKIKKAITDLIAHIANKSNPHGVTKSQIGLGNVENKSSATIRSELTNGNVTDALGYTPPTQNTTYSFASGDNNGTIKITPSNGSAQDVAVKGLGSAAYTASTAYLASSTKYAGSSSVGGAATSANKVNKSLTIQLNDGATEGTNKFTFNGSAEKTLNITPSSIGAAASSSLGAVAFSNSYEDLDDTPTVPTKTSQLTNDSGFKTTDTNTTYVISKSGSKLLLTAGGSGGENSEVDLPSFTDTGATSVEVIGSGNVVIDASYDSSTRKITLSKGSTTYVSNVDIEQDGIDGAVINRFLICETAKNDPDKSVSLSNGIVLSLKNGLRLTVKFVHANIADNPTLGVNGHRADIWYNGAKITSTNLNVLSGIVDFIYEAVDENSGHFTVINKYIHPTTAGNKHIPSGGSTGQYLGWSSNGIAAWQAFPTFAAVAISGAYDDLTGKPTVDTTLSSTSTNAVQNKVIKAALDAKVSTVSGKGLSTNDYSNAEKTKLAGIAENANNYSHPTHTAKSSGLYKVTIDSLGHVTGAGAVTKADITNLGVPSQDTTYSTVTTSSAGLAPILPTTNATEKFLRGDGTWQKMDRFDTIYTNTIAPKDGTEVYLSGDLRFDCGECGQESTLTEIHELASEAAGVVSRLASVATSGNYNDLTNKPTIPTVNNATLTIQKNGTTVKTFTANSATNVTANITVPTTASDVGAVPTSRKVNGKALSTDITIDIPDALADLSGDATHRTVTDTEKATWNAKSNFSGSYNDLTNKPTIPSKTSQLTNDSNFIATDDQATLNSLWISTDAEVGARLAVGDILTVDGVDIVNKLNTLDGKLDGLATVATSGSYNDLKNKPTIPTVNNGTLTIQKNGVNVTTFSANQNGNATANITVPTKVSQLTNDSEFLINGGDASFGTLEITGELIVDGGANLELSQGASLLVEGVNVGNNLVNKIAYIEQNQTVDYVSYDPQGGVFITNTTRFLNEDDGPLAEFGFDQCVPIVAGANISFDVDETSKTITINAEGGSSGGITVDKIGSIDTWAEDFSADIDTSGGIAWSEQFSFYSGQNLDGEHLAQGTIMHRIPIIAGDNVTFEVDDQAGTVSINATGGSSSTPTNASLGQGYGTCPTAAAAGAKTSAITGYTLASGGVAVVRFTYAVPANATLNITGTGPKPMYFGNARIKANTIKAGDTVTFMFDGTNYRVISIDRWQTDIASLESRIAAIEEAVGCST